MTSRLRRRMIAAHRWTGHPVRHCGTLARPSVKVPMKALHREADLQPRIVHPRPRRARQRNHRHLPQDLHLDLLQHRQTLRIIHFLVHLVDQRIDIPRHIAEVGKIHVVGRLADDRARIVERVEDRLRQRRLAGAIHHQRIEIAPDIDVIARVIDQPHVDLDADLAKLLLDDQQVGLVFLAFADEHVDAEAVRHIPHRPAVSCSAADRTCRASRAGISSFCKAP